MRGHTTFRLGSLALAAVLFCSMLISPNAMASGPGTPEVSPTVEPPEDGAPLPGIELGLVDASAPYVPATVAEEWVPALEAPLTEAVQRGLRSFAETAGDAAKGEPALELRQASFDGHVLTLDLAKASAIDQAAWEDLLHAIDMQVTESLYQVTGLQGLSFEYRILVNGKPLGEMIAEDSPAPADLLAPEGAPAISAVGGQKIVINPGHGYYKWSDGSWHLQRPTYWGIGEDFINLELAVDLNRFVLASGGDARPTRQVNKSAGNHASGNQWWQMGASEYVRSLGAPQSVWLSLPYGSNYDHDINARPYYANWVGANSMVSIHNNGAGSTNCNGHGTETWYDTNNGYQTSSLNLANALHAKLIQYIRQRWDANWCDRGVRGPNGGYGENSLFRGPAALVELGFIDVQSDNTALQNASFRAIAMAAINDGLAQYYGGASCPSISDWRGEYWNNTSLSGYPVLCRNDATLSFDWGAGGPGGSVLYDQFSARWTRTLNLSAGAYRFHLRGDDGVRLWVDNESLIDKWIDQGPTEYTADFSLSAGSHDVRIEYYERGGGAMAQFWYEPLGASCPNQYKAEYYNNRTLAGSPTFTRCEGWPIGWDWGNGGPGGGVGNDNCSARWTGQASMSAGSYVFVARADDGVRVWLDGSLILDKWFDQGPTEYRVTRNVGGGTHSIKVEYYENGGGAVAQFRWEAASSGNLALNAPAASTSQESADFVAARGNDGNTGTRWSSQGSNGDQWWWADLGAGKTYDQVRIRWETAYAAEHFVGWSDDGNNWTGYWYGLGSPGYYAYNIGTRQARYVAVVMRRTASCCGNYSFWEYEVYRTAATSAAPSEMQGGEPGLAAQPATPIGEEVTIPGPKPSVQRSLLSETGGE